MSISEYGVRSTDAVADLASRVCTKYSQPRWDTTRGPSKHADVSLAVHPLAKESAERTQLSFHSWNAEDCTLFGTYGELEKAVEIVGSKEPDQALFLNQERTRLFWPH